LWNFAISPATTRKLTKSRPGTRLQFNDIEKVTPNCRQIQEYSPFLKQELDIENYPGGEHLKVYQTLVINCSPKVTIN